MRVRFIPNVPVEMVLETTTGARLIRPDKPPERVFLAADGRRFYLPETSAGELVLRLAEQGIGAGEPISICLESGHGAAARWRVYRTPAAGNEH